MAVLTNGYGKSWTYPFHFDFYRRTIGAVDKWRAWTMFDSLDEQMKADEAKETTMTERILRWTAVAIIAVLVFGGLYYGVHLIG